MRELAKLGLGEDAAGALPDLSWQARTALHCWNFCAGWDPQRWPIYAALYPIGDWCAIVDLMGVLRSVERASTERQAEKD